MRLLEISVTFLQENGIISLLSDICATYFTAPIAIDAAKPMIAISENSLEFREKLMNP